MIQGQLAEAVGVSANQIAHVENGSNGLSLPRLAHICRVLGATPNDILAGEYGPEAAEGGICNG